MIKILDKNRKTVTISRHLSAISTRCRQVEPTRVDVFLDHTIDHGQLGVTWMDESFTITDFPNAAGLISYLANARWKSDARMVIHRKGSISHTTMSEVQCAGVSIQVVTRVDTGPPKDGRQKLSTPISIQSPEKSCANRNGGLLNVT